MTRYLFAKITKADEERREVEGVLAEEAVDKDNEKMDYEKSKPFFQQWNKNFSEKTDGKSVGNLRSMHKNIAAGKFISMEYDDSVKKIKVVAKVTNDDEWKQVQEGVYTGFSIGARRVGKMFRDPSDGSMRWTADPYEGSLVDNPAMYGANFTCVRADGVQEQVKFTGSSSTRSKGLYTVSWFANCLACLTDLASMCEYEEESEGDDKGAKIAAQVRKKAKELGDLLVRYTEMEVAELNPEGEKTMSTKTVEAGVRPAQAAPAAEEPGVRTAAAPAASAPAVVAASAAEVSEETLTPASVTKMITDATTKLQTDFETKLAAQKKELEDQNAENEKALKAANEAMEGLLKKPISTPVNVKGNVAVNKSEEASASEGKVVSKKGDSPMDVAKAIHAAGPGVRHGS